MLIQSDVFDVSRIIIRNIKNRKMTGVDNVLIGFINSYNLHYNFYFRYKFIPIVLPRKFSIILFEHILESKRISKIKLFKYLIISLPLTFLSTLFKFRNFYNFGHSGLNNEISVKIPKFICKNFVVLIHDLIPIRSPQFCINGESERHKKRMVNITNYADKIIFLSNITRKHYFEWLETNPCKVNRSNTRVINPASSICVDKNLEKKHFCMIGTIEPRKGYKEIIDLFNALDRPPFPLVIVGQEGWMCDAEIDQLRTLNNKKKLLWLDRCSDQELEKILSQSFAVIQNSRAEGYGLPIMEALSNGIKTLIRYSEEVEIFDNENAIYFHNINELVDIIKNVKFDTNFESSKNIRTWNDVSNELISFVEN